MSVLLWRVKRKNLYRSLIAFSVHEEKKLSDVFGLLQHALSKKSEMVMEGVEEVSYPSLEPCLKILACLHDIFESSGASQRVHNPHKAETLSDLRQKVFGERGFWVLGLVKVFLMKPPPHS